MDPAKLHTVVCMGHNDSCFPAITTVRACMCVCVSGELILITLGWARRALITFQKTVNKYLIKFRALRV